MVAVCLSEKMENKLAYRGTDHKVDPGTWYDYCELGEIYTSDASRRCVIKSAHFDWATLNGV